MAGAMARGFSRALGDAGEMLFCDSGSGRAVALAEEVGGSRAADLASLAADSDLVVLAVKRTALDEVAGPLSQSTTPVVSVLAGVPVARLQEALPRAALLRAMPNLPVEVGRGVVCYVPPDPAIAPATGERMVHALGLLGVAVPVDEKDIDLATAIMSCSPAYIALLGEALAEAGARGGLELSLAHELVVDTLAGTAELLRVRDPESIRRAVASPGGATEAGLEVLARRELSAAVADAVEASLERMRS